MIETGKQVSLEYTLKLQDGTEVDSNVGKDPLVYEQGSGQIIPGLEQELTGLDKGDSKTVTVPPEKAYGPVNPDAFQEIDRDKVPEESRQEGAALVARDAEGNAHPVRVYEVKNEAIVLDLNHPLAGQTLTFEVRVVDVQ